MADRLVEGGARIELPALTPRQARLLRTELVAGADDPDLSPHAREVFAWLARELDERLRAAAGRRKGRPR